MTRIAALSIDQASPAAQTLLQGAKAKLGMIPNLFSTLAHSPAALAGYLHLNDALQGGALSAMERDGARWSAKSSRSPRPNSSAVAIACPHTH